MHEVTLTLRVKASDSTTPEAVAQSVQQLLCIGLADAVATLEDAANGEDGAVKAAALAVELKISDPVVAHDPRVLVVVSGGVADPVYDEGVEVVVFDWDNCKADPEDTGGVPGHFADLAEPLDIPVEN